MISRLILSLKKASSVSEKGRIADTLSRTHAMTLTQIAFGDPEDSDCAVAGGVVLSGLSDWQVVGAA